MEPVSSRPYAVTSEVTLELSAHHRREIISWCKSRYPNEACGLLAGLLANGSKYSVERVYPVENAESKSPKTRYFMDPKGQFEAMRDAESRGFEIIGAFHSHTHSPAFPSSTDIELAMYPEWVWVIVSLASPEDPDLQAFWIRDGSVTSVEIEIPAGS